MPHSQQHRDHNQYMAQSIYHDAVGNIIRRLHVYENLIFTGGHFGPPGINVACVYLSVCVCQSLACLCDNSLPVRVRITKFETEVQKTIVKSLLFCRLTRV